MSLLLNLPQHLTGTDKFREAAIFFEKYGRYTNSPETSYTYYEFWKEQNRRCIEGYTVDGLWIPGTYYFYLNFTQILGKNDITGRKEMRFPRFTDVDLEFFYIVEEARKEKKGVILVKPRRTGFSFKNAALVTHEYTFYRDAKCHIGSFGEELAANTMRMCLDNLNFLDNNTEWRKERNPDTRSFVKARYKVTEEGITSWKGYMSEIQTFTFQNNPFAAIGKTSNIFLFEEAGKFDNLIMSYNLTEPCWKDGTDMTGIPIIYGTGGDMTGGTQQFYEMFYNPEKYNLLSFENKWDKTDKATCGWFLPSSRQRFGTYLDPFGKNPELKGEVLVDDDGNSNEALAEIDVMEYRKSKEGGTDPKAVRDAITQYPLKPREAFLRSSGASFPTDLLNEQLAFLETHTSTIRDKTFVGRMTIRNGVIDFEADHSLYPIYDFPLRNTSNMRGAVVMWDKPQRDEKGDVFSNRYIAGIDPYNQDTSKDKQPSLGSILIMDRWTERIVAEYTGRPDTLEDFLEICRRMLIYYNAIACYENNFRNLYDHFRVKNSTYLLADTPTWLANKMDAGKQQFATKGVRVVDGIIDIGISLTYTFLTKKLSEDSEKTRISEINSEPLLKELIFYSRDNGNYDRVSALFMLMIMYRDRILYQKEESIKHFDLADDSFFERHYNISRDTLEINTNNKDKLEL